MNQEQPKLVSIETDKNYLIKGQILEKINAIINEMPYKYAIQVRNNLIISEIEEPKPQVVGEEINDA